MVRVWVSNREF